MDWKSLMLSINNKVEVSSECSHDDVEEDSDNTICLECGMVVCRKLITECSFSTKTVRKRHTPCPVYSDIPDEFDSTVKNLAVTIYKTVTVRRIYRSTLRKAIIAACLYRASVILNASTRRCFSSFGLSNMEANRGIVFVSINLPPGEYAISMCVDKSEIAAACSIIGIMGDDVDRICRLFEKVKCSCRGMMASSQRISIIYGCIWTFIKTFSSDNYPKTIIGMVDILTKEISRGTLPVSAVTINKKYIEITKFILSRIMKKVFAQCLSLVCDDETLVSRTPTVPVTLYNCTDPEKIKMISDDGFVYPLEDVDDVIDWNILFGMDFEGVTMPIRIDPKTIVVSFEECPIFVQEMGQLILEDAIKCFLKD